MMMMMMRVIVLIPVPSLQFVGLPLRKIWRIFRLSINRARETSTFDLSTSLNGVTSHPCHGLLSASFQLAMPFHSQHGTNRRTDRRRPSTLYAPPCVGGA